MISIIYSVLICYALNLLLPRVEPKTTTKKLVKSNLKQKSTRRDVESSHKLLYNYLPFRSRVALIINIGGPYPGGKAAWA
jgi:hypothetical protein